MTSTSKVDFLQSRNMYAYLIIYLLLHLQVSLKGFDYCVENYPIVNAEIALGREGILKTETNPITGQESMTVSKNIVILRQLESPDKDYCCVTC